MALNDLLDGIVCNLMFEDPEMFLWMELEECWCFVLLNDSTGAHQMSDNMIQHAALEKAFDSL